LLRRRHLVMKMRNAADVEDLVSVFAGNLLNALYYTALGASATLGYRGALGESRFVGVEMEYKFWGIGAGLQAARAKGSPGGMGYRRGADR